MTIDFAPIHIRVGGAHEHETGAFPFLLFPPSRDVAGQVIALDGGLTETY